MENILKNINTLIAPDNVALLSIIITVLIFIISRHIEIRYKRHDDKKIQYLKLINLMQKSLTDYKKKEPVLTEEMEKLFFWYRCVFVIVWIKKNIPTIFTVSGVYH